MKILSSASGKILNFQSTVVELCSDLIRYASITPKEENCLKDLCATFEALGFRVFYGQWEDTTNAWIQAGDPEKGPHLCFSGHVDVVPPGDETAWSHDPFDPVLKDGMLYGRGIADMKGGIACFISALMAYGKYSMGLPLDEEVSFEVLKNFFSHEMKGCISFLLTSDEEGTRKNGTQKVIEWLKLQKEENEAFSLPDLFVIGEPTGSSVGSVIQVGRRGSLIVYIEWKGVQGHIAYPQFFVNPIDALAQSIVDLNAWVLDQGDAWFQSSNLAVTNIEIGQGGNPVTNIVPSFATLRMGIRFNPLHTVESLLSHIENICQNIVKSFQSRGHEISYTLHYQHSGDPFKTANRAWVELAKQSTQEALGIVPKETTQGGITDGSFTSKIATTIEMGLPEDTIHKVDERCCVQEIEKLKKQYFCFIKNFYHPIPKMEKILT